MAVKTKDGVIFDFMDLRVCFSLPSLAAENRNFDYAIVWLL